ncbi:MAG: cell surface protein SprA, partial [Fidelibacterota bacterium]
VLASNDTAWNIHFIDPNRALRSAELPVEKVTTVSEPSLIPNSFMMRIVHQGYDVAIPMVVPVDWYMKRKLKEQRFTKLLETIKSQRNRMNSHRSNASIKLISANIGNTPVSLNIKGDIFIEGGISFQDKGGSQINYQDTKSWDLDITQRQNFTIGGNIGERLSVEVDQDSEADFAWENNLVLNYEGRKDDIWQSGVAGNLSLNLPSSAQFVNGGTTKSNGLFGIKTVHQLGPLKITSIVSREQVKKSTQNISGGEASQEKEIHDYEFIKDKYFFIDDKFKNLFYPLDENEHVPTNHVLRDYTLYKLDQNEGSIYGSAYLNGDTTSSVVENGRWKELVENTDYEILHAGVGVIRMLTSVSQDAIGIAYNSGYLDSSNVVVVDEEFCFEMGDCAGDWDYVFDEEPYEDENNDGQWNSADVIILESDFLIYQDPATLQWFQDINENLVMDEGEEIDTTDYDNPTVDESGHILFQDGFFIGVYDDTGEPFTDTNGDGLFTAGKPIILKLIKQSGQSSPSKATWPLMLKNVYFLGATDIDPESFEISITHDGDTGEEVESPDQVSFLHIFGLDNLDVQGNPVDGGDGIFDPSPNLINFHTGELFLPMHLPFAYDTQPRKNSFGMYIDQYNHEFTESPEDSLFWGNHSPSLNLTLNGITPELIDPDNNFKTSEGDEGPSFYYATSNTQEDSRFTIKVTHSKRSSSIDLGGFMIVEGSEEVRLGGRLLRKDMDYNIDYFGGSLNFNPINCPECLDPTADIAISFEENELVSFDQKIMVGTAMEFNLNENFQLGGVAMYYNQSIVDEKVDIGYEPVRNFIWDINGKYALKNIDLLTNFVDNLPFVETDKPSNFSIEGEFAEVLPNPNPLGEAYLDDFESSKRTTSLGILQRNWKLAAPPLGKDLSNRGRMAWYNPSNDVLTNSIWPDLQVSTRANTQTTKVLVLQSYFQSDVPNDSLWNGVTTSLYPSEFQQSDSKYLDIWLNSEGVQDDSLRLHIDIGFISEDINNSGGTIPDTEDQLVSGQGNHILDGCAPGDSEPCEDVGLDGCSNERENGFGGCLFEPATYASPGNQPINTAFWVDPNDPNGDDWAFELHQQESLNDYRFINGTEGNGNTPGFTFPDTEDLNNDDALNKRNDYFTYTLRPNVDEPVSATENGGVLTGWKLYRILLSDFEKDEDGSVLWSDVEFVRLWMDGIPPETDLDNTRKLMIAKVEIVRNEWQELGIAPVNTVEFDTLSTFSAAVANTDENSDYDPPPGVQGEYDEYYGIRQREQSLVLSFERQDDGTSGGIDPASWVAVKKSFNQDSGFDPLSFKAYKNMEMFVFGDPDPASNWNTSDSTTVNLIFKFGKDADNYYQIMKPIYEGWDERNHINIDIQNLVRYKLNIESLDHQTSQDDVGLDSTQTAKENGCGGNTRNLTYSFILDSLGYVMNPDFYQLTFNDSITVCGSQYWEEIVGGSTRCPTCNFSDPNGDNWVDCTDSTDPDCIDNLTGTEGNGEFDFIDNPDEINGLHDTGEICEPFEDINGNGQFDLPPDNYNNESEYWEWVEGDCPECQKIRIKGAPAIDRINFITMGVENGTDDKIYGKMLVDELRMTNVKKERGRKMRLRTNLNFADLMDFSVDLSKEDANFHSLRQRLGTGNTTNRISVNTNFNPDKFLPSKWGVKTPVRVNYSNTVSAPKYFQGTDILTGPSNQVPDSIKTINQSFSINTSFRKNTKSEKWYLKYTIDNITIDNLTAKYSFASGTTNRSDISHDYSGKVSYRLSFGDNFIRPFKKLDDIPLIGKHIKNVRFYWTPKLFTSSMDVNTKDKVTENRSGSITEDPSFKLNRRFTLDYQLSKNILTKYAKTINSDLIQFNDNKI